MTESDAMDDISLEAAIQVHEQFSAALQSTGMRKRVPVKKKPELREFGIGLNIPKEQLAPTRHSFEPAEWVLIFTDDYWS